MAYFVQGLEYGVLAFGVLLSFSGGLIVLGSLCSFMNWIGDRINPDDDGEVEEDDE